MKLVREHIIFEKFTEDSDPIKDLGIGFPGTPGSVYKYHMITYNYNKVDHNYKWIKYYMLLPDKYTSNDNKVLQLTTALAELKEQRVSMPYGTKKIPDESQRSGYWGLGRAPTNKVIDDYVLSPIKVIDDYVLSPIDKKDKKRLIRFFSNKNHREYLNVLKRDEGLVPDFLEFLLI